MNILITGSTGFLGKNLTNYLRKNLQDINLSFLNSKDLSINNFIIDDKIDVVIHLAGLAHDLKSRQKFNKYYDVNTILTENIYNKFIFSKAKKFIFISSIKAVKDNFNDIIHEDLIPTPETHYGKSKLLAEKYIIHKKLPFGKKYFILRPTMIHGPNNKGNLNLLYKYISKGIPYPLAAFDNKRSYLSIENFCFIINEITVREDINSGIYNLSDDMPLSTLEIIKIIEKIKNKKIKIYYINKRLIYIIVKFFDILHLPINSNTLNKLTSQYIVSNNKIKIALNKELPITSYIGIEDTLKTFK